MICKGLKDAAIVHFDVLYQYSLGEAGNITEGLTQDKQLPHQYSTLVPPNTGLGVSFIPACSARILSVRLNLALPLS
jgi:hypothetical protein